MPFPFLSFEKRHLGLSIVDHDGTFIDVADDARVWCGRRSAVPHRRLIPCNALRADNEMV